MNREKGFFRIILWVGMVVIVAALTLGLAACDDNGDDNGENIGDEIEQTGDDIEQTTDDLEDVEIDPDVDAPDVDVEEELEETGEDIEEAAEETGEDIEEAAEDVDVGEALEETGDDIEEATDDLEDAEIDPDVDAPDVDVEEELEETGEDIEEAAEETGEDIEEAVEDVDPEVDPEVDVDEEIEETGDDIEEATDDLEDAEIDPDVDAPDVDVEEELEETGEDIDEAAEEAGDEIEEETDELVDEDEEETETLLQISVPDQEIENVEAEADEEATGVLGTAGTVTVEFAVSEGRGFVVIYAYPEDEEAADDADEEAEVDTVSEDNLGDPLGFAILYDGLNEEVEVPIDVDRATPVLFAALHEDTGEIGSFEYVFGEDDDEEQEDQPIRIDDEIVGTTFEVEFPEDE